MQFHPHGTARGGFTLIELLTVITIIMILVGMILSISGLVQNKQARSAAEGQMAAMSSAIESYKVDNGTVPRDFADTTPPGTTDEINPRTDFDPNNAKYKNSSKILYKELSGDYDYNRTRNKDTEGKSYFTFKPNMLAPAGGTGAVTAIVDPFGYSYGYSTARNTEIEDGTANPTKGYNPTYDLWSTGGAKIGDDKGKWIKNW